MLRLIKTHPFKDLFTSGSGTFNVFRVDMVQSHAECFATCPSPAEKKTTTEQSRHTEAAKGLFFVSPLGIPGLSLLQQQSKHSPSQIYLLAFLSRLRTFIAHTTAPTTIALCPGIQRWAPCNHPNQSISISSLLNLYSLYRVFQCFRPEPKLGKCVGRSADLGTLAFAIFSCCAKTSQFWVRNMEECPCRGMWP